MIVHAAVRELAEAGYGGFTMESIASRPGVAKTTIYRRWPDTVSLIIACGQGLVGSDLLPVHLPLPSRTLDKEPRVKDP